MLAKYNLHLRDKEVLHVNIKRLGSEFVTLDIDVDDEYGGIVVFASAEQLWNALKDLDLSSVKFKNMLEVHNEDCTCGDCERERAEAKQASAELRAGLFND